MVCLRSFIPDHPDLELISVSEQRLNRTTSRILVTMVAAAAAAAARNETENSEKKLEANATNLKDLSSSPPSSSSSRLNQFREKYFSPKN